MGRGAGCCNFKYSVNCTAPPCPSGSCCYVDTTQSISTDSLSIEANLDRFKCEDGVTENCCLSKSSSFFNKDAECGSVNACGDNQSVAIPTIVNTDRAFALLKHDGTVVSWGFGSQGGDMPFVVDFYINTLKYVKIKELYSNSLAFVAVDEDGNAITWGQVDQPHFSITKSVISGSFGALFGVPNVKKIIPSRGAFVAITKDNKVRVWGEPSYGGGNNGRPLSNDSLSAFGFSHTHSPFVPFPETEVSNIVEVVATDRNFAALGADSKVYIFGAGDDNTNNLAGATTEGLDDSNLLFPRLYDFRDVTKNGKVELGDLSHASSVIQNSSSYLSDYDLNKDGANNNDDLTQISDFLAHESPKYDSGFSNVKRIYSNTESFAFLKHDGTVDVFESRKRPISSSFGTNNTGGTIGLTTRSNLTNIKEIYNTDEAFLAVREDGKMVIWGNIETTENTDSDFYDQIHKVYPTKHAFGITYFHTEPIFSRTKVTYRFRTLGSFVPGRENLMEQVHPNYGAGKLSNPNQESIFEERMVTGSLLPNLADHFTSLKTDFYTSGYAIHHNSRNGFMILMGASPYPNSYHYSHTIRIDSNFGNYKSDIHKLIRNPAPLDKIRMKGAKNYVFTDRATAWLVTGDEGGQRSGRLREDLFTVPDYVISIGNHHYGGLGSSYLSDVEATHRFDSTGRLQGKQSIIGNRGSWIGLFSNTRAFCGIRFILNNPETSEKIPIEEPPDGGLWPVSQQRDVSYEVVVWGDENSGGFQSANRRVRDFANIFANTKDMRFTYAGCHPNYCDQDIK
tara:strand:- start:2645 stop:5020 length:2376 start_codon:yes stop_codon:yes gene_type:complete